VGRVADPVHGVREGCFVRFGGMGESAELADELDGRCANLVRSGGRRKVVERLDVAAHAGFFANLPDRSFLLGKEA
jgi:hypothetical protein